MGRQAQGRSSFERRSPSVETGMLSGREKCMEEQRERGYFYVPSGSNVRPSERCRHRLLGNGVEVGRSRWKIILYIMQSR